jgi:hypothetical protein
MLARCISTPITHGSIPHAAGTSPKVGHGAHLRQCAAALGPHQGALRQERPCCQGWRIAVATARSVPALPLSLAGSHAASESPKAGHGAHPGPAGGGSPVVERGLMT